MTNTHTPAPAGTLALEHRFDIQQVLHLYAHLIDAKSWNELDRVFSDDATYDMSTVKLGVYEGLSAIRGQLASMDHPDAHFSLDHVIGEARRNGLVPVRSKYFVRLKDRTIMDGLYDDRCILTSTGWRIRSRQILRTGSSCPL
ncbi:hypothetical protein CJ179_48015 [Rhodococcus sp. ACS1]|uniref:nuclear transport factor 2 family protein n=1 Tax=Rhodococcus sp. ACS1 TaxID=2028570 RepID=UPI000BB117E0|nr:nuclear transport factor 2 family protein [Rhodococcus sp. ACS1]PBC35358.1 hypothetical protein CJ179_48015 [Rhodococcus sp. ACS1]